VLVFHFVIFSQFSVIFTCVLDRRVISHAVLRWLVLRFKYLLATMGWICMTESSSCTCNWVYSR